MNHDPKDLETLLSQPAPYRTSSFAIVLLCAIAAGAVVIASIMRWPALKEQGMWQLAIFAGSALALCAIMFFIVRRIEARTASRRAARGEAPRVLRTGTGTLIFAALLFGGGGAFILWDQLAGDAAVSGRDVGYGAISLIIGLTCVRIVWKRIRQRR